MASITAEQMTQARAALPKVLEVEVTQADIDTCARMNPYHCAVANAVKRLLPNNSIAVSPHWVIVYLGDPSIANEITKYSLPNDATQFIRRFDCGVRVDPIKFYAVNIDQ